MTQSIRHGSGILLYAISKRWEHSTKRRVNIRNVLTTPLRHFPSLTLKHLVSPTACLQQVLGIKSLPMNQRSARSLRNLSTKKISSSSTHLRRSKQQDSLTANHSKENG